MIEEIKKEIQRQLQESEERLSHIKARGWVAPNEEQLIAHLKGLLSFIDTLEMKAVILSILRASSLQVICVNQTSRDS